MAPRVKQTVTQLYEFRGHLQQKWESVRTRLEQVYQLRLFEEDTERMSLWLAQQRHLFLTEYLDIGNTAAQANELFNEHQTFLNNCNNVRQQVGRLKSVANKLADSGHFASQQILMRVSPKYHETVSLAHTSVSSEILFPLIHSASLTNVFKSDNFVFADRTL